MPSLLHVDERSCCAVSGHMGDTRLQRHDGPGPFVQHTEPQRAEVHVPTAIVYGAETDDLAGEGLADEHLAAGPLDRAVGSHAAMLEAIAVVVRRPGWPAARAARARALRPASLCRGLRAAAPRCRSAGTDRTPLVANESNRSAAKRSRPSRSRGSARADHSDPGVQARSAPEPRRRAPARRGAATGARGPSSQTAGRCRASFSTNANTCSISSFGSRWRVSVSVECSGEACVGARPRKLRSDMLSLQRHAIPRCESMPSK